MKMPWSKASALNAGRRSTRIREADGRNSAQMSVGSHGRTSIQSRRTGNQHALPCARSAGRSSWQAGSIKASGNIAATPVPIVAEHDEGIIHVHDIVTKSVSRFARNTVDSLTTIRQLKEAGVEVYFEKENIWTFDVKGELLLTIMSSLAQEESRSISENCTWGQRKRFADGKVSVPFQRFLGYDRGPDGNLVVNREQAVIVKRIYSLFLQGMT